MKLSIAVTFHYVEERLGYLDRISSGFSRLADRVFVTVVTNTQDTSDHDRIRHVLDEKGFEHALFIPAGLGHPFLLTWSHFCVFRDHMRDPSYTHFMYLEDDTLITDGNMAYWMENRELLRKYGFIPSFLRVEKKQGECCWYSTDSVETHRLEALPRLQITESLMFVNLPTPYQGMYLLDRELMRQHLAGPSSNPDYGVWGIREKAAQGVTYFGVPANFYSRNLIPVNPVTGEIIESCLIHHTPDNYANQSPRKNAFGSIRVTDLIVV